MEKNGIEIDEIYANAKNEIIAFVKNWVGLEKLQYFIYIDNTDDATNGLITSIEENGVMFFDDYENEYLMPFSTLSIDNLYKFAKWLSFNYPKK